jgi:hypothetical protein
MVTKAYHLPRRRSRQRRLHRKSEARWLLILIARTLATILTMVVARFLDVPTCGGH